KTGAGPACEAGVQVPLLPDPRAGRRTASDVRLRPPRLQQGPGGADPRLHPRGPPRLLRGDLGRAHPMEENPRTRVPERGVVGSAPASIAAPSGGVRELLRQASEVPNVQVP